MSWPKSGDKEKIVKCSFGDLLKTSSKKAHQSELEFTAYPHNKELCVVHYLEQYRKRTRNLRGGGNRAYL